MAMAEVAAPPAELTGWAKRVSSSARAMLERLRQLEAVVAAFPDNVAARERLRAVREMARELAYTLCDLHFAPDQELAETLLRGLAEGVPDEPAGFLAQMATPSERDSGRRRMTPSWAKFAGVESSGETSVTGEARLTDDELLEVLENGGPYSLHELLNALGRSRNFAGALKLKLDKLMGDGTVDPCWIGGQKLYGLVLRDENGRRL